MTDKEKKLTAYHEAGHAVVGHVLPNTDPVRKVTIIPRGMALGLTWQLPQQEDFLTAKSKFEDEICVLLGGFVAENAFFGESATGVSNDIARATQIARNMVTRFGMSNLGPIVFGEHKYNEFLGDHSSSKNYSEEIAQKIDEEVDKLIHQSLKRTSKIIDDYEEIIVKIATELLQRETLDQEEFEAFFPELKGSNSSSKTKVTKTKKPKSSSKNKNSKD
jgi:cell division protease FtsH